MTGVLTLGYEVDEATDKLMQHLDMFDDGKLLQFRKDIAFPDNVVATIANWYLMEEMVI